MSGLNVKDIRINLGKSQSDFASMLGVTLRTVQNWEAGKVIPKPKCEILRKLADGKVQDNSNKEVDNNGDKSPHDTRFSIKGNHNLTGSGIEVNPSSNELITRFLDEIAEQRRLLEETIKNNNERENRLLAIIENFQTK